MSLYKNINKRRKLGISRSKSKSTISPKAYANMAASKYCKDPKYGKGKKRKLSIKKKK